MGTTATKKTVYSAIKRKKPLSKKTLAFRGTHENQVERFTTYVEIDGRHIIIRRYSNIHAKQSHIIKESFNNKTVAKEYAQSIFKIASLLSSHIRIYDYSCFTINHNTPNFVINIINKIKENEQ